MENININAQYGFWFFRHKMTGVLQMIALAVGYELIQFDIDEISVGISVTNNDRGDYFEYTFKNKDCNFKLYLAQDEDDIDIIFFNAYVDSVLKVKLEMIDLIQVTFSEFPLETNLY